LIVETSFSQEVKTVSFEELQKVMSENPQQPKLVNFWATWCKPCVDELPFFVKGAGEMKKSNVQFIFVSVDFKSVHDAVEEKVRQLGLTGTLLHLTEPGTDWIDKVDTNWSGAIPFTMLILPGGKKVEHFNDFENYDALKLFLDKNLSN